MFTSNRDYSVSTELNLSFEKCTQLLRKCVTEEGLRIIAEIPFHREFERHVGLPWANYTVFVVWSPFLAYQAVLSDRDAGIFMPFHLIVADQGESTIIAATNHLLFGRMIATLGAQLVARELTQKVRRIFSRLSPPEQATSAASAPAGAKETA